MTTKVVYSEKELVALGAFFFFWTYCEANPLIFHNAWFFYIWLLFHASSYSTCKVPWTFLPQSTQQDELNTTLFPWGPPSLLAVILFLLPPLQSSLSPEARDLMKVSILGKSIAKSFPLCILIGCGSLHLLPSAAGGTSLVMTEQGMFENSRMWFRIILLLYSFSNI